MIEKAIYAHVVADPAFTALAGARFYPGQAPQSSPLPVAIYGQADRKQLQTMTGVVNLNAYSMGIDVFAEDYAAAKALLQALRARLVGFSGELSAGVTVRGIFEEGGDDGALAPVHAEESGLYTASLQLAIHYGE